MAEGRIARLTRRGVVAVGGADAQHFLNDLMTSNIDSTAPGTAAYGGLLTPQGKVLFDFIVIADGGRFLFDLPRSLVADFVKRLGFYRLRAKVDVADLSDRLHVLVAWGSDSPPALAGVVARDPRLAALGFRVIVEEGATATAPGYATADEADYDAHRVALAIPEGGLDFAFGDSFPHDADMDQLGGVDFKKGCYIGQEVVSRMEHRGTARRRIVKVAGDGPLPAPGTEIVAGERPVGTLGSAADSAGLALVRLDRAKEAMEAGVPLTAGETTITLAIPDWASFGWPAAGGGE